LYAAALEHIWKKTGQSGRMAVGLDNEFERVAEAAKDPAN